MAFKNLFIESNVRLSVKNEQLVVLNNEEHTIPLEDINSICIDSLRTNITTYTLNKIVEHDIIFYVCDEKHLPKGMLLSVNNYSRKLRNLKRQIEMPKPVLKRMWQSIVMQKIENQALVLKELEYYDSYKELKLISNKVLSGDSTNMEAVAAAIYFKTIFGKDFSRKNADLYNSSLNYGYAIVRGMISRSLVMYGFEPALGIFHHNQLNAFNLADDIIECFRPLVDLYVLKNVTIKDELDSDTKRVIYNLINILILIDGKSYNIQTAIENVVKSLATSFENKSNDIKLPVLNGLKEYRYA